MRHYCKEDTTLYMGMDLNWFRLRSLILNQQINSICLVFWKSKAWISIHGSEPRKYILWSETFAASQVLYSIINLNANCSKQNSAWTFLLFIMNNVHLFLHVAVYVVVCVVFYKNVRVNKINAQLFWIIRIITKKH